MGQTAGHGLGSEEAEEGRRRRGVGHVEVGRQRPSKENMLEWPSGSAPKSSVISGSRWVDRP